MSSRDDYSRLDYRRLIAWPQRIERERPFLEELLAELPSRRVLDIGCGTGEHARFLLSLGCSVTAIDRSPTMLEKAREEPLPPRLHFLQGDFADLAELVSEPHGAAICLGNMLPHLRHVEELRQAFGGLRRRLLPGAPFLLQILNYDRIFATGQRALPVSFRELDGETVVFLRLMTLRDDGSLIFNPTSLRYRPAADPPVEVVASKNVELRGWRSAELLELLGEAGFAELELFGGMCREPWDAAQSIDLVAVAR